MTDLSTPAPFTVFSSLGEDEWIEIVFLDIDVSDTGLHPWHASMGHKIQADPTLKPRLDAAGFVYIPGNDLYGDSVMTPDYTTQHWGRFFDVLNFLDDRSKFWQAVVTCRGKLT